MAKKSKYDLLLYLDCDSAVISDSFLSSYVEHHALSNVIYGGRTHGEKKPDNNTLFLRWLYGIEREDKTLSDRKSAPYLTFKSNNFLIDKNTFLSIKFNESFIGYGHEDTYFAQELKEKNIPITHIDNPVLHIGLENNQEFLSKTKEGLKNLTNLLNSNSNLIATMCGVSQKQVKSSTVFVGYKSGNFRPFSNTTTRRRRSEGGRQLH